METLARHGCAGIWACVLSLAAVADGATITATWNGGTGLWTDTIYWSTHPNYPNNSGSTTYDVVIDAGNVTLAGSPTIQHLALSNGTIKGSSSLNVLGGMTWTGSGGGFDQFPLVQVAGSSLINGSGQIYYAGALGFSGDVAWMAGSPWGRVGGPVVTSSGSFDVQFDGRWSLGGPGEFRNSGTFTKTAGAGAAVFEHGTFLNSGTVRVQSGSLQFDLYRQTAGTTDLAGNGITVVGLAPGSPPQPRFELQGGKLVGTGTVNSNVFVSGTGTVAPNGAGAAGRITVNGNVDTSSQATFELDLGGLTQGFDYDHLDVNGSLVLSTLLSPRFIGGFENAVTPTSAFTVITADGPITGIIANAVAGRVNTADGKGSFQVFFGPGSPYGANNLVLSNFVPIPEPATALACALALVAAGGFRRRR